MHPFFNSTNRILALTTVWLLLTVSICMLLSQVSAAPLIDCLVLFVPLYLLCVIFIIPNYYVCRGLPLGQTSWPVLIGSHLLMLFVILTLWVLAGQLFTDLLEAFDRPLVWSALFDSSLRINASIVVLQFEVLVLIHYLYFALEKSREIEKAALQQKLLISQAELQALRATVHPHFLFNSLNTLANIALSAPEKAHRFCLLIAEFLRYSVAYSNKSAATLGDEVEHMQNYLGIERERFGERLQITFDIDDSLLSVDVPPLLLFPVVENAIKHGIDSCLEGGLLSIVARRGEDTLIIEVTNPVDEMGRKLRGAGHGLSSVEQRLKNIYSERARLNTKRESGRFTAQIYLPISPEREQHTEERPR